jgi:hypothetical protein
VPSFAFTASTTCLHNSIENPTGCKPSSKLNAPYRSGPMGFGEDFYPIPWSTLEYDTNLGGYRLDVTKEQLKTAPKYTESTGWNWNRQNDETVHNYYMAPPYCSQLT